MTASLICPRCDWRAGVGDEVRYACESCGWGGLDGALDDL